MLRNRVVFFVLLVTSSCNKNDSLIHYYNEAIYHFVTNDATYFPINNYAFLNNLYKERARKDCGVNLDSIIDYWSVIDKYGNKKISVEKERSVFMGALLMCQEDNFYHINIVKNHNDISSWSLEYINNKYNCNDPLRDDYRFESKSIPGLPYSFKNNGKSQEGDNCLSNLEVSYLYKCNEFYFIELLHGCKTIGRQKKLYVLKNEYGKVYIDNIVSTDFKF